MKTQNPPSLPLPFVHPAPIGLPLVLGEVFFMEEIWKTIKDYPNYEISNYGKLRRNYIKYSHTINYLNENINKKGYLYASMSNNGKTKHILLHRLVGFYFVENIDNKPFINHIDGNKKNNYFKNLEWVTSKENSRHAYDVLHIKSSTKGKFFGEHNRARKVIQKSLSGEFIKQWDSISEPTLKTGAPNISACCYGIRKSSGGYKWEHVD